MSSTSTTTFTRTHAVYIASKVAADLRQMQNFYDKPSDAQIDDCLTELVEHLVAGFIASVEYGFRRNGEWIVSLRYEVRSDGTIADTGSGRVYPYADLSGLGFYSYLITNGAYASTDAATKEAFRAKLPFQRTGAEEPKHLNGYWETGKSYSAGGVGAVRSQWRPA
jgi:Bacterial HORMA domain family 1